MVRQKKPTAETYSLRISEHALQNIDEITGFIAFINQQPVNAIKIGNAIFALFDKIVANPFGFKECELLPTKTKMYRQALCLSWSIIFKIIDNEILILGIIHKPRKPSKLKVLRKIK